MLLVAILCAACGEPPAPPQGQGVFDGQIRNLDRARGIEQTLQNQADERRKALEEAERR